MQNTKKLLSITNLKKYFPVAKSSMFQKEQLYVRANEDITLDIYEGETLGIVGESGCGKSTLGRVLLQLYPQTAGTTIYYGSTLADTAPAYVEDTLKNLDKYKQKLQKAEAKVAELEKKVAEIGEDKADFYLLQNRNLARCEAKTCLTNIVKIMGGFFVMDENGEARELLLEQYKRNVERKAAKEKYILAKLEVSHIEETPEAERKSKDAAKLPQLKEKLEADYKSQEEALSALYNEKLTQKTAALDEKADLVDGKVPSSQLPETSTLELGTTATTAYYGDKGKVAYDHSQLTSGNPHHVTKGDVGLGDVDNTSDANKPVSTAQQTAINGVQDNLDDHVADTTNPHEVTKSQVGLGNVDNTSDASKPVSTLQKAAIDAVQDNLDSHEEDVSNPHSVTKAQVGLGNVDNTSDADKPVSTAQQSAISGVQSNLTTHIEDVSNPHGVTKSQVGLGNVDNTSDANKPISSATQTALNGKADLVEGKVPASQLPDNIGLELGTTATTAYYGDKGQTAYDHSQLTSGNPHHVTKSDVGLGNVDNTSDADKPISTAVQAALDTKMTGTYSGTTPNLPTINGSAGSQNTVSRGDHTHPSETFTLTGLTVSTSSWVADNTYGIYTWRASIINSSITANHTPIVMFSQIDSSLGIFSQVAETASGVVYIYASEIPESTTTINSIIFIKDI